VNAHALAQGESALGEESVMGGGERFWQTSSLCPGQPGGDRHRLSFMNDGALGLPATTDHCHNSIADRETGRAWSEGLHFTCQLESRDVRGDTGRRRITASHLREISRVHAGGADSDEELAGAGPGIGMLLELEGAVDDRGGVH
jgi:hypothetical protein